MTIGLWVIRWRQGGTPRCTVVVPYQRPGWLAFVEQPSVFDKRAQPVAVFTDELPSAQVFGTREAAVRVAVRYGIGDVVDLEVEWSRGQRELPPATENSWAATGPSVECVR